MVLNMCGVIEADSDSLGAILEISEAVAEQTVSKLEVLPAAASVMLQGQEVEVEGRTVLHR